MRPLISLLLLHGACALAQDPAAPQTYEQHARLPQLMQQLRGDYGFSAEELDGVRGALASARKIPKLIEQEQKAPERTETWTQYSRRIDAGRISGGQALIQQYAAEFARAEEEFGVPAPVIAGIMGIETRYGRITGSVRVLDALATQGLDHPTRSPYFLGELAAFFAFCRDFSFSPLQPAGSYAGAMGAAQFMPSNYRRLALDFDGDGRRDLWSLPDAIGSIAYYLTAYNPEHAWQRGEPLIVPARVSARPPPELERNSKRPIAYLHQLAQLGIEPAIELPSDLFVGLIELPLDGGGYEYWLGLPNFYSVMTYNPRTFYAMAVAQLASQIAAVDAETAVASAKP